MFKIRRFSKNGMWFYNCGRASILILVAVCFTGMAWSEEKPAALNEKPVVLKQSPAALKERPTPVANIQRSNTQRDLFKVLEKMKVTLPQTQPVVVRLEDEIRRASETLRKTEAVIQVQHPDSQILDKLAQPIKQHLIVINKLRYQLNSAENFNRSDCSTMFEDFDNKANQLYYTLSQILKKMKEMGCIICNIR